MHTISVRVGADLKGRLEQLAKADERTLSAYINRALRLQVEAEEAKLPKR